MELGLSTQGWWGGGQPARVALSAEPVSRRHCRHPCALLVLRRVAPVAQQDLVVVRGICQAAHPAFLFSLVSGRAGEPSARLEAPAAAALPVHVVAKLAPLAESDLQPG